MVTAQNQPLNLGPIQSAKDGGQHRNVDVHDQSGPTLSKQPAWTPALNTDAYAAQEAGADAAISAILAANLPHADTQRGAHTPRMAQRLVPSRP